MALIRTVGHGTAEADVFADLLEGAGIGAVIDVRRYPGSRRHPHFGRDALAAWLGERGIRYRWAEDLGGRRTVVADSVNVGMRNASFRGYADHMASTAFAAAMADVLADAAALDEAGGASVAVMCSESLWWRCHRRLLADHLVLVAGREVEHLFHDGRLDVHHPTPEARRNGDHVTYDVGALPL